MSDVKETDSPLTVAMRFVDPKLAHAMSLADEWRIRCEELTALLEEQGGLWEKEAAEYRAEINRLRARCGEPALAEHPIVAGVHDR